MGRAGRVRMRSDTEVTDDLDDSRLCGMGEAKNRSRFEKKKREKRWEQLSKENITCAIKMKKFE